jgi:hypothetical protein
MNSAEMAAQSSRVPCSMWEKVARGAVWVVIGGVSFVA